MTKCTKCKTRIATHLWIVGTDVYCSPSCQRGKAGSFEKLYKALAKMRQSN